MGVGEPEYTSLLSLCMCVCTSLESHQEMFSDRILRGLWSLLQLVVSKMGLSISVE